MGAEFLLFCQLNPKPCPLVGVSANPGDIAIAGLAEDMDIRTDVPRYKIFEHGELVREVEDIREQWRDDLVIFALGCSFSFEEALLADGLEIRNVTEAVNVPMYRTNIACKPAGRFSGDMVVSMRPMKPADAIRAIQICSASPPCMAHRSISVIQRRSASAISAVLISAMRSAFGRARCRSSGPAV